GHQIPSLEHATWRDPTITPSRLAISSRLSPSATSSLIFSITCGVNLTRLPLTDELAFVIVMVSPFLPVWPLRECRRAALPPSATPRSASSRHCTAQREGEHVHALRSRERG